MSPTEALEQENEALRAALWEQWEFNHSEHCGGPWPHPQGERCHWPIPIELGGDPTVYHVYIG